MAPSFAPSVADRPMPTRGGAASHTGRGRRGRRRRGHRRRSRRDGPLSLVGGSGCNALGPGSRCEPGPRCTTAGDSGSPGYQVVQDLDLRRATPPNGGEVLVPWLVLPAEVGAVVAGQNGSASGRLTDASGDAQAWTLPRGPGPTPDESELIALETDCHRAHPPSLAQPGPLGALYPPANPPKPGIGRLFRGTVRVGPGVSAVVIMSGRRIEAWRTSSRSLGTSTSRRPRSGSGRRWRRVAAGTPGSWGATRSSPARAVACAGASGTSPPSPRGPPAIR